MSVASNAHYLRRNRSTSKMTCGEAFSGCCPDDINSAGFSQLPTLTRTFRACVRRTNLMRNFRAVELALCTSRRTARTAFSAAHPPAPLRHVQVCARRLDTRVIINRSRRKLSYKNFMDAFESAGHARTIPLRENDTVTRRYVP